MGAGAKVGISEVGVSCTYSSDREPDQVGSAVGGKFSASLVAVGRSAAISVGWSVGKSVGNPVDKAVDKSA